MNSKDPFPRLPQGCNDRCETTTAIRNFWQDEWKEGPLEGENLRKARWLSRSVRWLTGTRRETVSGSCQTKRPGERRTRARQGQEGAQSVAKRFHQVVRKSHRTMDGDGLPAVGHVGSLQKPGKTCTVENLRPTSVQTVRWRLFESAQIQSNSFKK